MTSTPSPRTDNTAVATRTGVAAGGSGSPVLELDDVTRTYPGEPPVEALRGVNLTLGQGELVGILGPSGSGKTTLLQLIGTLDRPTSGKVWVTGLDVAAFSSAPV